MPLQLQDAFDEITAVLKKHDVAGVVILSSPTHTEYKMEVSPSWSCAWLEPQASGAVAVRVRSKRVDYPSLEAQKKIVTETVGMFAGFADVLRVNLEAMMGVLVMLGKNVDISHISRRDPEGDT